MSPYSRCVECKADTKCGSYLQFHPLTYLLKLYIEMNIATLIGKVVKDTTPIQYNPHAGGIKLSEYPSGEDDERRANNITTLISGRKKKACLEDGESDEEPCIVAMEDGIRKTVETNVMHKRVDE
jgi:hypothetical protein